MSPRAQAAADSLSKYWLARARHVRVLNLPAPTRYMPHCGKKQQARIARKARP